MICIFISICIIKYAIKSVYSYKFLINQYSDNLISLVPFNVISLLCDTFLVIFYAICLRILSMISVSVYFEEKKRSSVNSIVKQKIAPFVTSLHINR